MGRVNAACLLLQLQRLVLGAPDGKVRISAAQQPNNQAAQLFTHPPLSLSQLDVKLRLNPRESDAFFQGLTATCDDSGWII